MKVTNPSLKDIQKQLEEFQDRLSQDVTPFSDIDDPSLQERYSQGKVSFFSFAKLYTPHYVDLPFARFHHMLIAMTEFVRRHLFIVPGPREHGKTVILRIQKLRFLLYGMKHYMLKVSEKLELAQNDIAYLLSELEFNARVKSDFDVKFMRRDDKEVRIKITSKATGLTHFVKLEPLSYGTPVVGSLFMQYRPDYAEVDDFGNRRSDRNIRIGREKVDWIKGELFLAMDKAAGPIIWVGNNRLKTSALNHALEEICQSKTLPVGAYLKRNNIDSLVNQIKRVRNTITAHVFPSWIRYKGKRYALWPEKMTLKELDKLAKDLGTGTFEGEMQQNPVEVGILFKPEWFPTYKELPKDLVWASWIDQSLGKAKTSDFKAIVVGAGDGLYYYVVDGWVRRASLAAMVRATYVLYKKYGPLGLIKFFIENNFGQYTHVSKRDFQDAAKVFGFPLPIKPKNNVLKKEARIEGLEPLMENGYLLWPEKLNKDLQVLKDQLLGYPDAANDDGPDALSGMIDEVRLKVVARKKHGYKSIGKRRYDRSSRR